jgi:hypothetical protein
MWTRKDINDFKELIRKEESDAIIKVGTLRVEVFLDDVNKVYVKRQNHFRTNSVRNVRRFFRILFQSYASCLN